MKKIAVIISFFFIQNVSAQNYFNTISVDHKKENTNIKTVVPIDTFTRDKKYYTVKIKETIDQLNTLEANYKLNDSLHTYHLKYYDDKLLKSTSTKDKEIYTKEIKLLNKKNKEQFNNFKTRQELLIIKREAYKDSLINQVKKELRKKSSFSKPGRLKYPVKEDFVVTSKYGYRTHPVTFKKSFHNGIDVRAKETSIYPIMPGRITKIDYDDKLGIFVEVTHPNDYKSIYGHLSQILLLENSTVNPNTPIAVSGNTGRTTAAHLHLILKKGDQYINPEPLFN